MKKYNILYEYKNLDSLKFVLEGLHERTGKKSSINQSYIQLDKNYEIVEKNFNLFYPDLKTNVEKFRASF
jgi:acyl carrier protein phosphodiesterase